MFQGKQKKNVKNVTVFSVISGVIILSLIVLVSVLIVTLGPPSNRMEETLPSTNATLPPTNATLPPTLPPCQPSWIRRGSRINGSGVDDVFGSDLFGGSMSLTPDGNILVVGAVYYGVGRLGQTNIFEYDGSDWIRRGPAIDGTTANEENSFSVSISADGNTVASGAYRADGISVGSGFLRLFTYDGNNWDQIGQTIDGDSNNDRNGYSTSLSSDGSVVATGSVRRNVGEGNGPKVRVFEYNGNNNWIQRGSTINWEDIHDITGNSVSLSSNGNTLAFGAPWNSIGPTGYRAGATRIFDYDGNDWVQRGSNIYGESADDYCGHTVSLSSDGNTVATASPDNDNVAVASGHVRIFDWDGSAWTQRGANINGTAFEQSQAGRGLALSPDGNTVAIGLPYHNAHMGLARVYKWDITSMDWIQQGLDFTQEEIAQTGASVSLSTNGDTVAISSPLLSYVEIFDLVCI